jgi:hypothetical protein
LVWKRLLRRYVRYNSGWRACGDWRQQPIRSCRAEPEQLRPHLVGQAQVTVRLERGDQFGQERHRTLPTNPVGCREGSGQGLLDLHSVPTSSWSADWFGWSNRTEQQANGVFPLVAGHCDKLVEDV